MYLKFTENYFISFSFQSLVRLSWLHAVRGGEDQLRGLHRPNERGAAFHGESGPRVPAVRDGHVHGARDLPFVRPRRRPQGTLRRHGEQHCEAVRGLPGTRYMPKTHNHTLQFES